MAVKSRDKDSQKLKIFVTILCFSTYGSFYCYIMIVVLLSSSSLITMYDHYHQFLNMLIISFLKIFIIKKDS